MKKRRKQLNASNEVETNVMEVELNDATTEIEVDQDLELDLSDDQEFDQSDDIDVDESDDHNEPINATDDLDDELEFDSSDDVDVDSDDNTDEVEKEVEGTESTEKSIILPSSSQSVRENLLPKSTLSFDLIRASITNPVKRFGDAGILSVVNSKNGTRLSLSKELYEKIEFPDSVQFGFIENELIVGKTIGDDYTNYDLKSQGAKQIIYCKELISQVTESYSLDFSDRSSITVHEATYEMLNDNVIARIKMN